MECQGMTLTLYLTSVLSLEVNLICREMCRQGRWKDHASGLLSRDRPVLWRLKVSRNSGVVEA